MTGARTTIATLAAAVLLAGCTPTLDAVLEQVGAEPGTATAIETAAIGAAVRPIVAYCQAPEFTRSNFRDRVNGHPNLRDHQIAIWCKGDPELTLPYDVPAVGALIGPHDGVALTAAPAAAPAPPAKPAG